MLSPLRIATLLLVLVASRDAEAITVLYDAASGDLPEAHGWTYENFAPSAPAPSVSAGVLHPQATTQPDTRWWQRVDVPAGFEQGFEMEIVMKVVSSTYDNSFADGSQRSGFYYEADDTTGRRLALGLASTGITLNTDAHLLRANGIPFTAFNTTNDFHRYVVTAFADSAVLTIDGARIGAVSIAAAALGSGATDVYFGDGSGAGASEVQIERVRFGDPQRGTAVPPGISARAGGLALAVLRTPARDGADVLLSAPADARANVRVVDPAGRCVAELGDAVATAAGTRLHWDGRGRTGERAASGIYLVIASGAVGRAACRVVVLR